MELYAVMCVVLATCVIAENDATKNRSTKMPFIADAVGNTLPPPSGGPATVGSPSKLLTPDRYEFYTFDESGELVKRLMTLEEIQAIVAAGEGADGHLVTLSTNDQPSYAFNFSQPPFTKVHSVVTNVQNVLKAQMEAQKNNPPTHTSLDTPDVSDSWSLILPSIFGNTGVDIVPDKTSNTFTIPETETIEEERPPLSHIEENYLSKEANDDVINSTIRPSTKVKETSSKSELPVQITSSVTHIPTKIISTNVVTTVKPKITTKATIRTTTHAPKRTTLKYRQTTKNINVSNNGIRTESSHKKQNNNTAYQGVSSQTTSPATTITSIKYEKISTVTTSTPSPNKLSLTSHKLTKITNKPLFQSKNSPSTSSTKKFNTATTLVTTELPLKIKPLVTTYKPVQSILVTTSSDFDKDNITTLTTQSVSPSTTISSTEFMNIDKEYVKHNVSDIDTTPKSITENNKVETLSDVPIFDVAQSISQIASDLGNNFPHPTTSNLLDTTNMSDANIESKENIEMDIPNETRNDSLTETTTNEQINQDENKDLYVKISTIDPSNGSNITNNETNKIEDILTVPVAISIDITTTTINTPIDPMLSESMDDLLSQIVNQIPQGIMQSTIENAVEITTIKNSPDKLQSQTTLKVPLDNTSEPNNNNYNINNVAISEIKENLENITKFSSNELNVNPNQEVLYKNTSQELNKNNVEIINNTIKTPSPSSTHIPDKITSTEQYVTISQSKEDKPNTSVTIPNLNLNNFTDTKITSENTSTALQHISHRPSNLSKLALQSNESKYNDNLNAKITNSVSHISMNHNKINVNPEFFSKEDFKKKIQKVNIDDKELVDNSRNNSWKLVSTVSPPKGNDNLKDKVKIVDNNFPTDSNDNHKDINLDGSKENQGLEITTTDLGDDVFQFTELCNELAFRYWSTVVENIDKKRSFVLSPYSVTSLLAMMFMGARGATSGEMNDILKLDDMVTFNPHFTLKNISDSIETSPESGVAVSAFIRELYSDRNRGKILTFYKERAQHFYNGHVEEISFKQITDIIRRRTNLLVKRYTWGKINEYMKTNSVTMQPPLAAFSANIFEMDCTGSSVDGRDGEMYFVVSPNVRQRRLVPVPAVVYRKGFLAGYDPVLDATAASIGTTYSVISTLFLMPGQQGNVVHADDLEALERRLLESNPSTPTWNRLLRTLLPRVGLELQIPRFSHKSTFNISSTLKVMGLKDLFDHEKADLAGLNGPSKDLYLSDMIQTTTFATCGEGVIGEQHHVEEYPESPDVSRRRRTSRWATGWEEPRDYQRAFHDPHDVGEAMHLPLHLRPRQARLPARNAQPARLKFDRPFLYFVRHNPTGMILYFGRYNPRLLP